MAMAMFRVTPGKRQGSIGSDPAGVCIGADGIWKVVADCTCHGTDARRAASEIAETELRMEAGVPVAGLVIRARKNGANDKFARASDLIAFGHSGCRGGICIEHVVSFVRHKRLVPEVGRRVATDRRCQPAHGIHSLNERGRCEIVAVS